jgi:GxxExxY protein
MPSLDPIGDDVERIARDVVDGAFRVHTTLGPGLLESVYEACLVHELAKRQYAVQQQVSMPVVYDGLRLEAGFRLDLIVRGDLIVEIKAVEKIMPVHEAQVLTYLKLTQKRLGLLINFNVPRIKEGIKRFAL